MLLLHYRSLVSYVFHSLLVLSTTKAGLERFIVAEKQKKERQISGVLVYEYGIYAFFHRYDLLFS